MNFKNIPRKIRKITYRFTQQQKDYANIHLWARKNIIKPCICLCEKRPPVDLHNIPGTYENKNEDWVWLCRKCHSRFHAQKQYIPKNANLRDIDTLKNICT